MASLLGYARPPSSCMDKIPKLDQSYSDSRFLRTQPIRPQWSYFLLARCAAPNSPNRMAIRWRHEHVHLHRHRHTRSNIDVPLPRYWPTDAIRGANRSSNNSSPRSQTAIGPTWANRGNGKNLIKFDDFFDF